MNLIGRQPPQAAVAKTGVGLAFVKVLQLYIIPLEGLLEHLHQPQVVKVVFEALAHQKLHSILYEYGIFKQKISDGWQSELPDYWLPGGEVWLEPVPEHTVEVHFGGEVKEGWDGIHHMVNHTGCPRYGRRWGTAPC